MRAHHCFGRADRIARIDQHAGPAAVLPQGLAIAGHDHARASLCLDQRPAEPFGKREEQQGFGAAVERGEIGIARAAKPVDRMGKPRGHDRRVERGIGRLAREHQPMPGKARMLAQAGEQADHAGAVLVPLVAADMEEEGRVRIEPQRGNPRPAGAHVLRDKARRQRVGHQRHWPRRGDQPLQIGQSCRRNRGQRAGAAQTGDDRALQQPPGQPERHPRHLAAQDLHRKQVMAGHHRRPPAGKARIRHVRMIGDMHAVITARPPPKHQREHQILVDGRGPAREPRPAPEQPQGDRQGPDQVDPQPRILPVLQQHFGKAQHRALLIGRIIAHDQHLERGHARSP
jgi:hypothetical protein